MLNKPFYSTFNNNNEHSFEVVEITIFNCLWLINEGGQISLQEKLLKILRQIEANRKPLDRLLKNRQLFCRPYQLLSGAESDDSPTNFCAVVSFLQ